MKELELGTADLRTPTVVLVRERERPLGWLAARWCDLVLHSDASWASQVVLVVKNPPGQCRRPKEMLFPSLGWKDSPGEGNGNPLQNSCLENPMDRGAWWAIVHRITPKRSFEFFHAFLWKNLNELSGWSNKLYKGGTMVKVINWQPSGLIEPI